MPKAKPATPPAKPKAQAKPERPKNDSFKRTFPPKALATNTPAYVADFCHRNHLKA